MAELGLFAPINPNNFCCSDDKTGGLSVVKEVVFANIPIQSKLRISDILSLHIPFQLFIL